MWKRFSWKERVNWKASRATSGAAHFCEVRISGGVEQVGTWNSCGVDQVSLGNSFSGEL